LDASPFSRFFEKRARHPTRPLFAPALIVPHRRPYSPTPIPIRHDTLGGSVNTARGVPPMPFDDPACFRLDRIPVRPIHWLWRPYLACGNPALRRGRPACAEGRSSFVAMVRSGLAARCRTTPMRVRPTDPHRHQVKRKFNRSGSLSSSKVPGLERGSLRQVFARVLLMSSRMRSQSGRWGRAAARRPAKSRTAS
jgi:hypothetical protein